MRRLFKPGVTRATPLEVARVLAYSYAWPIFVGCVLVGISGLISGAGLGESILWFISESLETLTPLSVIVLSHWLMYLYLYYVIVPCADLVTHGSALTFLSFLAIWSVVSAMGLRATPRPRLWNVALTLIACYKKTAFFQWLTCRYRPRHLAVGWVAGFCPQIFYE